MSERRVIVCGGRRYADARKVRAVLDGLRAEIGRFAVVTGGATGADTWADGWARDNRVDRRVYYARWGEDGVRAAGPVRNRRMLAGAEPVLVVAFPGGAGTADMVRAAREAGVEVREVE